MREMMGLFKFGGRLGDGESLGGKEIGESWREVMMQKQDVAKQR